MDCRRLGRIARKVVERCSDEAVDAADVDHATLVTGVLGSAAARKERKESRRYEVVGGSVCAIDVGPILERGIGSVEKVLFCLGSIVAFGFLRGAVDAGIVDQDV